MRNVHRAAAVLAALFVGATSSGCCCIEVIRDLGLIGRTCLGVGGDTCLGVVGAEPTDEPPEDGAAREARLDSTPTPGPEGSSDVPY